MATFDNERALVLAARDRLEGWLFDARDRAYDDLFEGDDAILSEAELRRLDRIDSTLSRRGGQGAWGTDRYGIVPGHGLGADEPRVVCVYHPEIPDEAYPGEGTLDERTRERFNEALWEYCERVAEYVRDDLEEFLAESSIADE